MARLIKTAEEEQRINAMKERMNRAISEIEPYSEYIDIELLKRVRDSFEEKVDDFYQKERKLNIGIIGQVKAGKSTFLNTLLFDGKSVLPSARTPKTAILTKIEYSENNCIEVEYYDSEEWHTLKEEAKEEFGSAAEAAREIIKMAEKSGTSISDYSSKGKEVIEFASSGELMGELDNYVGVNGCITPFVKNVTIKLNKPELAEISVVDTPGLNDAIVSRTDKTRAFIEKCDVVFFLSRASQFLEKPDMDLITSQLPQQGVQDIILICSRFDDGLLDVMKKSNSVKEASDSIKQKLTAHAKDIMKIKRDENRYSETFLKQCSTPVFVSTMMYNASRKKEEEYDSNEAHAVKRLRKYCEIDQDILSEIGNMDDVNDIFNGVIIKKDEVLRRKAESFVPKAEENWQREKKLLLGETRNTLLILQSGDKESIIKQRKMIESRISNIKASLEKVFGELLIALEKAKNENMKKIREASKEYNHLNEHTGTEWHSGSCRVGGFSFLGLHFGGHTERYNYSTTYTYLAASDALENVRNFGYDASSEIEATFHKALDPIKIKGQLLRAILDSFGESVSDDDFDINHFKYIVELSLNRIAFPIIKIDVTDFIEKLSSRFSGEVRGSSERSELQKALSEAMDNLFDHLTVCFTDHVKEFRKEIETLKESFKDELLSDINESYDKLQKQFENKEIEISNYEKAINVLENV